MFELLHAGTITHSGEDERYDKWKKLDTRAQGLIALDELEIKRDEVDRDKSVRAACCYLREQDDHFFAAHVLDREHLALDSSKDGELLL